MNAVKERLIQFIDYQGISNRKFCIKISVSHVYFSTDNAVGSDVLEKISYNYPDLNMDWVITGRGEMLADLNVLADPGIPYKTKNKLKVKDSTELITHELVEMKAMMRVMLRSNAELLAKERSQATTETLSDFSKEVEAEISTAFFEAQRRYGQ